MSILSIKVINSFDQFNSLSSEWTTLLRNSRTDTFFLTWEWLLSWAECCLGDNRTLFVLSCYKKKKLIGIAPFYIERKKLGPLPIRELRFLGTPESGSDYLDVIVLKSREKEVADAIYDYLTKDRTFNWDQLIFSDIRADSLFLHHFLERMRLAGKHMELAHNAYCPIMHIPNSEIDFFGMMSAGWRKKFKQDMRVSSRDYTVSHTVIQGHEVADHLAVFFRHYVEKGGWNEGKMHSILKQLLNKYIEDPPLQLDFLTIDGKLRAALLHFKYQKTLSMYLMAVDKKFNSKISIGNILVGRSIINKIGSEYTIYDFLKGTERYKFHWATGGYPTVQIRFWKKSPGAICSALGRFAKQTIKLFLR